MPNLITLVHGTYNDSPPWTLPDSQFKSKLQANLKGGASYEIFKWSSKNSHNQRMQGAKALAAMLLKQKKDFPEAKKVIVAHSHGGNLALYALKLMKEEASEFKLITMATPFFNIKKRILPVNYKRYTCQLTILFLILPLILFFWLHGYAQEKWNFSQKGLSMVVAITLSIYSLLTVYIGRKISLVLLKAAMALPDKMDNIMHDFSYANIEYQELLIVIHRTDEVNFVFKILKNLWESLVKQHRKLYRLDKIFSWLSLPALIVLCILYYQYAGNYPRWLAPIVFIILLILLYTNVFFVFVPLVGICVSVLLYCLRSHKYAAGGESLTYQLFIKIDISTEPKYFNNLTHVPVRGRRKKGWLVFGLRHSIYYYDVIFRQIAAWIERN